MKHLLNNLTEEEKNSIREQHTGGMNVVNENFSKLINTKSGEVKTYLNEQSNSTSRPTRDKIKSKETAIDFIINSLNSMKNNKNVDINGVIKSLKNICKDMEFMIQSTPGPMSPSPKNPMP
jgi:hypothetical protein